MFVVYLICIALFNGFCTCILNDILNDLDEINSLSPLQTLDELTGIDSIMTITKAFNKFNKTFPVGCNFSEKYIKMNNVLKEENGEYRCDIEVTRSGYMFYYACSGESMPRRCPYVMTTSDSKEIELKEDDGFRIKDRTEAHGISVFQVIVDRNVKRFDYECTCVIDGKTKGFLRVFSKASIISRISLLTLVVILAL